MDSGVIQPPRGAPEEIPSLPEPEGTILKNNLIQVIFNTTTSFSFFISLNETQQISRCVSSLFKIKIIKQIQNILHQVLPHFSKLC